MRTSIKIKSLSSQTKVKTSTKPRTVSWSEIIIHSSQKKLFIIIKGFWGFGAQAKWLLQVRRRKRVVYTSNYLV